MNAAAPHSPEERKMAAEEKEIESQGAVSFMVNFNDVPSKPRRLPKGLAARREQQQAKASLTEQTIAEKQKRAEERRQVSRVRQRA